MFAVFALTSVVSPWLFQWLVFAVKIRWEAAGKSTFFTGTYGSSVQEQVEIILANESKSLFETYQVKIEKQQIQKTLKTLLSAKKED